MQIKTILFLAAGQIIVWILISNYFLGSDHPKTDEFTPAEFTEMGVEKDIYFAFKYFKAYELGNQRKLTLKKALFTTPHYGLQHDPNYCMAVDGENFMLQDLMFKEMRFVSDYDTDEHIPRDVMNTVGLDTMPKVARFMPKKLARGRNLRMDTTAQMFFMKFGDFHIYHKIGTHFACASQMYNHIPGDIALTRKMNVISIMNDYAKNKYGKRPQCFQRDSLIPLTYRLFDRTECMEFMKDINSDNYQKRRKLEPNQYVIKVGYGAHRGTGVFLLDEEWDQKLRKRLGEDGEKCGADKNNLLAQRFIEKPMLFNGQKKFDFRIYLLIASTNPLIAYYHDGFLKLSIVSYDPKSTNKNSFFTNTNFAEEYFKIAEQNGTYDGQTSEELRQGQTRSYEQLQEYLIKAGYITDQKWVDNYLRPGFMKALAHLSRAVHPHLMNKPNLFEMFGIDFVLDENLKLWFIEVNRSPQILSVTKYRTELLIDMFYDLFDLMYSYYRSRMKRLVVMLRDMAESKEKLGKKFKIKNWKKAYKDAVHNRLEPEFPIKDTNSFYPVIDMNLPGADAYFGLIDSECI